MPKLYISHVLDTKWWTKWLSYHPDNVWM